MPRSRELALILLVAVLAAPLYASALAQRTFVASYGSDASACSVTAPCRSFATAVSKTTAGGEVIVLDSAGYGPVVIMKSVSIIAPPGVYAGISVSGSANPGVHLNAPGIVVRLSGLTITGLADNNYGIVYQSAAKLVVDRVTVTGFTGASGFGIVTSTFGSGHIDLTDVVVRNSGIAAYFNSASGTFVVGIERSQFDENQGGVDFADHTTGSLRNVTMRANAQTGLSLSPSGGASAEVECDGCIITDNGVFGVVNTGGVTVTAMATLRHSVIARNNVGINSQNGASTYCSDTTITKNGTGVDAVGSGTNYSFGDNMLYANTTDGGFTTLLKQ